MEKNIRSLISKFEVLSNSIANETNTPKPSRPRFNFAAPKAPLPKEKVVQTPKEKPVQNNFYKNNNAKLNDIQLEISETLNEISALPEIPIETFINVLQTLVQHLITLGSIDAEGNYNLKQKKAACFQKIQECNAEIMKGRKDEKEEPKSVNNVREIEKEAFENKIYKEKEAEEEEEVVVVQFKSVKQMKNIFDSPGSPILPKNNIWKSRERLESSENVDENANKEISGANTGKAESLGSMERSLEVVEIEENDQEETKIPLENTVTDDGHVKNLSFENFEEKREQTVPTIEIQAATPMTPIDNPQEFPNLKSVTLIKHFFEPNTDQSPSREHVEKNAKLNKLMKELEVEEDEQIIDENVIFESETNVNSVFEKICDNLESDTEDLFEALVNEETESNSYEVQEIFENKESEGEYSSLESSDADSVINTNSTINNENVVNSALKDGDENSDSGDTIEYEEKTEDTLCLESRLESLESGEGNNNIPLRYPVQICPQVPEGSEEPKESNKEESRIDEEIGIQICPAAPEGYKGPSLEINNAEFTEEYNQEIYKEETKSMDNKSVSTESRIVQQIVELKRSQSEQSLDGLEEIDDVFGEITKYRVAIDKFDPKKDLSKFDELEMQLHMLLVRIEKIKTNNNEQLENMKMDGVEMIGKIIESFHAKV